MNALKVFIASVFTDDHRIRPKSTTKFVTSLLTIGWILAGSWTALAQRAPTIIEPKARTDNGPVKITKQASQTKGVLAVLLDPIISGKVVIESLTGQVVEEATADENGEVQFTLKKGQAYRVKASMPGYISDQRQSKVLQASDVVRLKLTAQTATLNLQDLPSGAQVFIDDLTKPRTTVEKNGGTTVIEIAPDVQHTLTIKHPEYRDFQYKLQSLKAGSSITYPVLLDKVARLTIQALPEASVLIDGEVRGKTNANGEVVIEYVLAAASEHTISVEKLGYEISTRREQLAPGARTIPVKLDPIVTSAGVGDVFDDLSLWAAPSEWKIRPDRLPNGKTNNKLVVSGEQIGAPKGTVYRDFQANFTLWLPDGKGAAWAVRIDKSGKNYYLFYLAGPNAATPKKFYTYLVRDGQVTQVNTPTPVLADLNQKDSYTIDVTVQGFTITHAITSNATGEKNDLGIYTDITETKTNYLYGTFGFRSFKGESFVIDDFTLQPTKEEK